jgi:hypothetical protein
MSDHLLDGGGALFLTLTVKHCQRDELAPRLALMAGAMGRCLRGKPWERRAERHGYVGLIRAVEVTYGVNGWHPHVHALLVFERPLGGDAAADLSEWLYGRWRGICEADGFGVVTRAHGVDVQVVSDVAALGSYLAKVEGGWGAGQELARGDVKRAGSGGQKPFELLSEFAATGDTQLLALWLEYERATFGKQAIVWSRGLRARLLPDEPEVSDEEAATVELGDETWYRVVVPAEVWNGLVWAGQVGELLVEVEWAAAEAIAEGRAGRGRLCTDRWWPRRGPGP